MNHSLIRLWCAMKGGFYMTTGNDQLSSWSKKLQSTSQSQTCTKKRVIVTVWWSAAHLIPYSFLNLSITLTSETYAQQISKKHQKLQGLKPVLVKPVYQSTERAQFFSMTTPNYMLHSQHFKSWRNWAIKFCLIHPVYPTSGQPTITSSSTSTTFCRKNASTTSRRKKMLSKRLLTHEAWIFMLQE